MSEKLPTDVIRVYINSLLFLDSKILMINLYSKEIITLAEKNIVSGVSNSSVEQMDKLLTLLLQKFDAFQKINDRKSYMNMFAALLKCIAENLLMPQLAERMLNFQQTGKGEGIKTLAEARASLGSFDLSSLDFFVSSDETDAIDFNFIDSEHLKLFHYYPINLSRTENKSGYVLIIDIRDYSGFLKITRTSKDAELIKSTFESLNYKVEVETDLSASAFAGVIERHLKSCELAKYSSFTLFVMAFGDENDLVCGVDGHSVSLSFIKRKVQDFTYLSGCPKLFFFLSARGVRPELKFDINESATLSANDDSVFTDDRRNSSKAEISEPKNPENVNSKGDCVSQSQNSQGISMQGSTLDRSDSVPKSSDCFVCYACQRNCTVFGLKEKGSWFANIFCGLLLEHSRRMHLMDLITEVSYYMSSMKLTSGNESGDVNRFGQLPEVISTLRKRFYFVHPDL